MTDAPIATPPMTLKGFVRLYDIEDPFEFVDGERIPLMPNHFDHSLSVNDLPYVLNTYVPLRNLGMAFAT